MPGSPSNFLDTPNAGPRKEEKLDYQDHKNFGYKETVAFLKDKLKEVHDGKIVSCLKYESVLKTGDENAIEFEEAKIAVALLYGIRLFRPNEYRAYGDKLRRVLNSEIAAIVSYLDASDPWPTIESWPHILTEKAVTPTSNSSAYTRQKSLNTTPKMDSRRQPYLAIASDSPDSPITAALNSSRGREVTQNQQLRKKVIQLEQERDLYGSERDKFQDKTLKLQKCVQELSDKNERLNKRIKSDKEMIKELEDSRARLQRENSDLKIENNRLKDDRDALELQHKQIIIERDDAQRQFENGQREIKALEERFEAWKGKLKDEKQEHDYAREKLIEYERNYKALDKQWKNRMDEKEQELRAQAASYCHRLELKDDEIREQMETSSLIQGNYMSKIQELENEVRLRSEKIESENETLKQQLVQANENNCTLENSLEILRRRVAEVENQTKEMEVVLSQKKAENNSLRERLTMAETSLELHKGFLDMRRTLPHLQFPDDFTATDRPQSFYSAISAQAGRPSIVSSILSVGSTISSESSAYGSDGYQERENVILVNQPIGTPTSETKSKSDATVEFPVEFPTPVRVPLANVNSRKLGSKNSARTLFL
ncbi:hypothetical protein DdX_05716 [Ditylenchus destructor]|uniref:Uncharacterized protein n=1 Tax=Ditylenchus destructor TaxID=166010 RepID=A0AAD4N834_9BILA|nr:hypothetical protein DdX_05716 [Ditylenchus destructor]